MILFVFLLVLLKQLFWTISVPIFQTPDEQAHFAQLSYIAENKTINIDSGKNLSLEIATVEDVLGTRRDGQGNNKYTYHPEYKNNSPIPELPLSYRTIYVDREASGYPPLYYLVSAPLYLSTYPQSLYWRVMATRILSLLLGISLALVSYKIGWILWQDKLKGIALAIAVTFQPMVSFVSAGIHPDNLLNLLCSVMVLMAILIIKGRITLKYLIILGLLAILSVGTKQTALFFLPVILAVLIWKKFGLIPAVAFLFIPAAAFIFRWNIPYMPYVGPESPLAGMDFGQYLHFRLPKLAFEMWPWYWGVFKWLGVTLPALWMKIITRVAILAVIGLVLKIIFEKRNGLEYKSLIFFIICNLSFIIYLFLWDWRLMQSMGFSQGLQGRYLFPLIVPQMALLLMGLWKFGRFTVIVSAILMVVLNIGALFYVSSLYS